MALTGDTSQIGSPMMTGESPLQYYLRIGMDPNQASSTLVGSMTGNTAGNPVDNAFKTIANSQRPHAQQGWFGGPQVTENVNLKPTQQWTGNDAPGSYRWQDMPGATAQNNQNYMTTLNQYAQAPQSPMTAVQQNNLNNYRNNVAKTTNYVNPGFSTQGQPGTSAPNQPGTTWDGNIKNLPAMNQGESSQGYMQRLGLSDQTISYATALSQANPTASFQDIMQYIQSKQGVTNSATNANASTGLPPIQAGEDSSAYMKRIGMSDNAIQYALGLAKANPGASFQQIMAYMQTIAKNRSNTSTQGPAAAAQQQEAARQAAWAQYYAAQAQKGGNLSQSGNIRYGETPVLMIPRG